MARVIEYKKPVLTATLTEGGDLQPNTTYYMTGFFNGNYNQTYRYSGYSPMADVISFTTTDTHKSVSISWRSDYYDIVGFSDNGDGKTRVIIPKHNTFGYLNYNQIVISGGTYDGKWNVEYGGIDYLIIDTEYVDTYSTQGYFDNVNGSWASEYNYYSGLVLYLDTTNPYSTGDWILEKGKFSHRYYGDGYENKNPIIIDDEIGYWQDPPYHYDIYKTYRDWKVPDNVKLTERGKPQIILTEETTWDDLMQVVKDCDVEDRFIMNDRCMMMYGDIIQSHHYGAGELEIVDKDIIGMDAVFNSYGLTGKEKIRFENCSLAMNNLIYKAYLSVTANNCLIKFGGMQRIPVGMGNTYFFTLSQSWYLNNNYEIAYDYTLEDVTFKGASNTNSLLFVIFYGDYSLVRDVKLIDARHLMDLSNPSDYKNNRVIQSMYIESDMSYDIMISPRNELIASDKIISLQNVDTPRDNNLKKIYNYGSRKDTFEWVHFYRTGTITIVDKDDNVIEGVTITITDNEGTIYSGTTDVDGEYDFDVIEQKSYQNDSGSSGEGTNYLLEFDLKIEKESYYTYEQHIDNWKGLEKLEISLKPTEPPIYYQQSLNGSINNNSLSGNIEEDELSSSISISNINGIIKIED